MKKHLTLLFAGLALCATAFGLAVRGQPFTKTEAATTKSITLDENGMCKLGSYPQDVTTSVSAIDVKNNGAMKQTSYGEKYYIYNNSKYVIIETASVDPEGSSGKTLSNGENADSYNNQTNVVVEFKDIEWQLLKEGEKNTAYLISTRILDREIYNSGSRVTYDQSSLNEYLNTNFKDMAFDNNDNLYLVGGSESISKVQIDIPTKEDIDINSYEDKNLKQASDYAILKNLTSHSAYNHGVGVPFTNAGYWLNTFSSEGDRVQVCWAKVAYTSCLIDDPKIGVRPVIQVNYSKGSGGGSPSKSSSTPSNVDGALIAGIITGTLGGGALIAFFILWSKKAKVPGFKAPGWYYAIIFVATACCCVSIITLSTSASGGGGASGSSCFKTGYYVQQGLYSGGGAVQVVYTAWLLKSDGTVSFCSRIKDKTSASDFDPDNYMTGTYEISGSKLTITIPKHEIQNFGTVGGTYTYTIKGCDTFKDSVDTYKWVRGE